MLSALRNFDLRTISIYILAVLLSITLHEMAHAIVSYWFGDPTAMKKGRVSLNPLDHIDWLGMLSLLLFGFGWAKPVPVDPYYYKDAKTGMIWTAFAGPVANFLLAFVCVFVFDAIGRFAPGFTYNVVGSYFMSLLSTTAILSVGFGVFNLIPIPPLDGSRIFWAFLPDQDYFRINTPPPWVSFLFLIIVFSGLLDQPLSIMNSTLITWMNSAATTILNIF